MPWFQWLAWTALVAMSIAAIVLRVRFLQHFPLWPGLAHFAFEHASRCSSR